MKTARSVTIDPSILPETARQELHDFYRFLVDKYVTRHHSRREPPKKSVPPSAAALAASPIVGIWKDRELGDSSMYARSLRDKAQNRNLLTITA